MHQTGATRQVHIPGHSRTFQDIRRANIRTPTGPDLAAGGRACGRPKGRPARAPVAEEKAQEAGERGRRKGPLAVAAPVKPFFEF